MSSPLLLEDECPQELDRLLIELSASLNPVGTLELTLIERIAVTIWRQRRLIRSETANITLNRIQKKLLSGINTAMSRNVSEVKAGDLAPFDQDQLVWCRNALAEIDGLEGMDLQQIRERAPFVMGQIERDAEDTGTVEQYLANHKGGLASYMAELTLWCRQQVREAEARPEVLALAEQVKAQRLTLSADSLELISRYQTTLDNQLYKALRALREAQEWRIKTIDQAPATDAPTAELEVAA